MNNPPLEDNLSAQSSKRQSDLESKPGLEPECSPNHKSPGTNTPNQTATALVLDDFLTVVADAHRSFKIAPAELSLGGLGLSSKTRGEVTRLLNTTIELHHDQVFTMAHPLLDPAGDDIYGEEIKTVFAPRHKVSPGRLVDVLSRVLELMLQTIVALPSKDPARLDRKAQKSLASSFRRLSERVSDAIWDDGVRARLQLLPARPELWKLPGALQDAAKVLESVANLKVTKVRRGSPNPQIRFTLYLANWVKRCTGRQHYTLLADLITASFQTAGKQPPKWIERLEIEMNRQIKYRAKFGQMLLSQPHPLSASQPPVPPSNLTN